MGKVHLRYSAMANRRERRERLRNPWWYRVPLVLACFLLCATDAILVRVVSSGSLFVVVCIGLAIGLAAGLARQAPTIHDIIEPPEPDLVIVSCRTINHAGDVDDGPDNNLCSVGCSMEACTPECPQARRGARHSPSALGCTATTNERGHL
ncbi:hypothetical protein [Streptomyces sp. L2]|uniref:hypothetical protein n=1 Tax=Streptomyces sp. L2 TaxID=2162665 RepID=UPI001010918C|nr:hypothetical protein [Streptomyces sp. L2]